MLFGSATTSASHELQKRKRGVMKISKKYSSREELIHVAVNIIYARSEFSKNGCLEYRGFLDAKGYPMVPFGYYTRRGTRVIGEFFYDAPVEGTHQMCHTCDNPKCLNPDHLYVGTNKQNCIDRLNRRGCEGTGLKAADVRNIKNLWATGTFKRKQLADLFGVTLHNMQAILNGNSWGFVGRKE